MEITADKLEAFCQQLLARSRDIAKTHDALVTLETFIKNFSASQYGSTAYHEVETVLARVTEQSRLKLMQQRTDELVQALRQQNIAAVSAIHTPMSRNGFYEILQVAAARLEAEELRRIRDWAVSWTSSAKQQADQLSAYPDAPDFRAAGIVLEEYLAMSDVSRYLHYPGMHQA